MSLFKHQTCVSLAAILGIVVAPTLVDVAWAQQSQPAAETLSVFQTSQSTAGVESSRARSLEAKLFPSAKGVKPILHVQVTDGGESASFTYSDRVMQFSDGYSVTLRTLANTDKQIVKQITAVAPDHAGQAVATFVYDRNTSKVNQNGLDRVRDLLAGSKDFLVVSTTLPSLVSAKESENTSIVAHNGHHVARQDVFSLQCLGAVLGLIGACFLMMAACAAPQPAEPIVCYGSILVFMGAGVAAEELC